MSKKLLKNSFKTSKEMDDYLENTDLGEIFAKKGKIVKPSVRKINLDLPDATLLIIDEIAGRIGVSRQPLLKMWIHEKLKEELASRT